MKTVEKAKNSKRKIPSTSAQSPVSKTKNAPKKTSVSLNKLSKKNAPPPSGSGRKLLPITRLPAGPARPRPDRGANSSLRDSKRRIEVRKYQEDWLQKSKLLFHINPASIILISLPERKITDVNEACLKTFGFSRKETIGKTSDELNIFVQLEKRQKALEQLLEQGYIDSYELKVRRKDGTILDGLFSGEVIERQGKTYVLVVMIDQTSRKRFVKSQRESEEKYRTILENTQEGYFETDLSGNFTFFSDSFCKINGYTRKELMGMNNRLFTDKETVKKTFKAFNKVYKTKESIKELDLEIIRKDGIKKYVELSVSLQEDLSGKPIGFRGIIRDITKRKQAEEKLRESEANYRQLFDNSPAGIYQVDYKNGRILKANDVFCEYAGCSQEEINSLSSYDILTEESNKLFLERVKKISQGVKVPEIVEFEILNKKGKRFYIQLHIKNIYDAEGHVVAADVVAYDITEHKKTEEALRQSEEKYRLLADHMKDQVWIMDLSLRATYISPSVEKLLGYTLDEIKKLSLDKLLTSASLQTAMDFFSMEMPKALAAPSNYSLKRPLELEFHCKNGQTVWGECMLSFIRDENGEPLSILGEGRNITERKQMEDSLRKSEENFRHSLDDSPLGVRISTTEGETIYANRSILDIYGYDSIEELKKIPINERYVPESYIQFLTRKEKRLQGEFGPSEYEISIVRKNGEARHLHVFRKEIFWNGKKQSQVIYQDITLRRKAEEKLNEMLGNLRKSIRTTIQVLGTASEARDPYTAGHQKKVADLARAIATEMKLPNEIIEGVRMAGAIHDIGKISIPSEILCKPSTLSDLEFSLIKAHTQYSYEIIKDVESPWPLADIVYQHHERINGSGYPQGLKGENILIEARILAVADVVEAMISYRPYRPALGMEIALTEIEKNTGTLYDRNVANACLKLFREKGFKLE